MRFFRLTLAYDGTAYAGWQIQPDARTIQEELESALNRVTSERIRTVASGRTDAGVHALGQVASFSSQTALSTDVLRKAIDANMPRDIVVRKVEEAPRSFHAIRDVVRKRYRYVIQDGPICDVFAQRHAWHIPQSLDAAAMQAASGTLVGTHDFKSFEASGSPRATSVRTITDLTVQPRAGDFLDRIVIEVEADGFLYNMVRIIVGSLAEVGRGKQPPTWIAEVLQAKNRKVAGMTAPSQGLFLVNVEYHWCCESHTSLRG